MILVRLNYAASAEIYDGILVEKLLFIGFSQIKDHFIKHKKY